MQAWDIENDKNYRNVRIAIDNFKQIMSRPAPDIEQDSSKQYLNPLIPGKAVEGLENEKFIAENMTILAQFDDAIDKAALDLEKAKAENKNIEIFFKGVIYEFEARNENFENTYLKQA